MCASARVCVCACVCACVCFLKPLRRSRCVNMVAMRPGDWLCPSCGNHNYASKVACNRCQAPKADNGGGFAPVKGKGAFGKGAAGVVNTPYAMAMQPAAPGQMRPGDWCCSSCGNHNYASKMACNKCQIPKMQSMFGGGQVPVMANQGWPAPVMANPGWPAMDNNVAPHPALMMGKGQGAMMTGKGQGRPGDWTCHACGNHNYASRTTCNKKECGIAKDVFIAKSGMRPGDWLCPMCTNHNYADKVACKKCSHPRGNTPPSMANMKEGDWLCPYCNNHNYKDKVACNRCQAPKP